MNTERDPRVDPQPGDKMGKKRGHMRAFFREVTGRFTAGGVDYVEYLAECRCCKGSVPRSRWQEWARDAEAKR